MRDREEGADEKDENHIEVHTEIHQRGIEGDDALGFGEIGADLVGRAGEFLLLVFFPDEALDHAHSANVLLDGFVQLIVFAENAMEGGHGLARDENEAEGKDGNDHGKGRGEPPAHIRRHAHRKDQHQRTADGRADHHHEGHLNVIDVGRYTRDQRGGGKTVDIGERKGLYLFVNVVAKIAREAGGGLCRGKAGNAAAGQRNASHGDEQKPDRKNVPYFERISFRLDRVDEAGCRDEGNQRFDHRFSDHQKERQDRGALEFPQTAE